MMPAQGSLTSSLALLVLLGTVRAGPFSSRSNVTLPAPRPPPQPGGRTEQQGGAGPSSQLYEHTVEGGEKQVVFTHRINLPNSGSCGCPPGTEPPVPASEVQALRVRLEILEELVKGLKEQCTGGCCPAAAQAGTGQTDVRSLCSLHGVFDLSRCACSCEPGWGGPTCSDPTDAAAPPSSPPSASRSCPDDCNDQGRCVRGRCVCFPGYTGPSCSWPSCPGDCHGRGRCVQGVCVCRAGFSGADCSLRSCPRGCSQRGRCENGRCVCNPGYTGEDCGVRSCPRGCSQKGRCEDGRCVCDPGYAGEDCGSRSCPWDCGEGGRCVDGRCVCWPGYAGEDCSTRTCPRDCRGRGRCEEGECICDPGYSGDDCGVRSCPGDCNQRGRCEDGRCVCWPGYSGPDCGARACPRDCRGHGRCENGVCVCNAGYSGEDCGVRSCPGDCRGRGRCESGRCVCWPGYTGRDCGTRACPGDCRGRCVDGRCVCNPGFTGEDCGSRRCPGDCRGRGRCEDGVCLCDVGYEGEDCGVRSCPRGCQGRGQCLEGRCVCDDGYEGEDCGVRRCTRDCSQRGVCQDGVCACWEGYTGEDCSLRTCPSNCHRRGRCEDGRCVCDSGYTGPYCATRTCPADCRGRGRCVQGVCVCHAGYSGEDCGQEGPPASACLGGCGPRELCRAGQCVCVEGFRGPDCAIQTCPGDCRGRGECREGSCVCQDGYAGEDCGEEVPAVEGLRMHLLEETMVRTEWTRAPGNVDAYEIQFIPTTEGPSPPFTARVPSSASAYDQRGLAPGQEYQVTVRALRGTSWGPPASKTITTMIDGPQDLRVVAVTPTTLELNWLRPQAEVDQFVVSYVSAGNQRVRLEVPSEADGTLLTGLMPGVEYVVTVTAERGRAVSYPASVRANTAPGHFSHPEAHAPAPSPRPRPRPVPAPRPPRPPVPPRPSRPAEEGEAESRPGPNLPQPPRRAWGNLTDELGRFRGTAQDLERHLRAHGYPLRANQTYTSVARHIHEYLQRRRLAAAIPTSSPAPPARRSHPASSPDSGTWKRDSNQGTYGLSPEGVDRVAAPRHPKPEVLGSSADGALLVSLDGLRGYFERVVLRWRPQPPAEGPGGELTVPGTTRTVSLPDLKPGTTYHVEVHGVRAGQTSKSYAFITTTGSSPSDLLGATDEPPPSGPSTTQGAQAPVLQQRPQELAELRVLGRDKTGHLRVAWTAQPDTFAHFQLRLRVPEGPRAHEELLPGDARQALLPSPPPGSPYELSLRGVPSGGEPSAPLIYQGIMDRDGEKPGQPLAPPHLGKLMVTDMTSNSLLLHWTVPEGEFDSFVIQYKDRDRPQVVPVEGPQRSALISNLDIGRKYKFVLYGLVGKKRHGPLVAEAKILPQTDSSSVSPPRLGKLWVTDPTPDSLHLSWTVPEGQFDSFVVQYRDRDGRPQVVPVEAPERSVIVSPLDPDHKYRFTLFGIVDKKRHGPLTADGTTAPEKREEPRHPESPEQPLLGELTVTGSAPDSLRLSWTVAQGAFDSFMVQYKDAQGRAQAVPIRGHENEVTIPGLESDRKYKMNLYGLHGRQRVGPVSVVATTAPQEGMDETLSPTEPSTEAPEPPEEPLLGELTVIGSSPDSLSLSWTVPQGHFNSFTVQYRDRDGQPKVMRVPGHQDGVTISGLEPDHKYKMNLYGFHDSQRVGPVSVIGVTTAEEDTPSPTEPSTEASEAPEEPLLGELTVTGSSPDSLSLSWTVPQGHFDSFTIQYKGRDGPQVVRVGGEESEVTAGGLEPGRKYKMHLYGLHGGRRVGPVSTVGVTASLNTEPPVAPRLGELAVAAVTSDTVHLSWTVDQGPFDSFLVRYKDVQGQPQAVPVGGHLREVSVSGLAPGHKYKFLLFGLQDEKQHGPVSADAKTLPDTKPSLRLGELTVTEVTPDSMGLSWTVPEGEFDSFVLQYKDRDGQPHVVPVASDQREITIPGLEPNSKYKFLLYGLGGRKRLGPISAEGSTAPLKKERQRPPRLGELTVTDETSDSLRLLWTVAQGPFDSFVVQYRDTDGQPSVVPVAADQREVTIEGLEPGRKYKFLLYGLLRGQHLGPVSVLGMTAPEEDMPAPSHLATEAPEPSEGPRLGALAVKDVSPDSLRLSWSVAQGPFDSFVVQYQSTGGEPQALLVGGDQNKVLVSGLEPSTSYKFFLYGLREGKRLGPVSAEGTTGPAPAGQTPGEPGPRLSHLSVTDVTTNSLRLSWEAPPKAFDSFLLRFGVPSLSTLELHPRPPLQRELTVPGTRRSAMLWDLSPGTLYTLTLYGLRGPHKADGIQGTARTLSPALERPRDLQFSEIGETSAKVSWMPPPSRVDSFKVSYQLADGGEPQSVQVDGRARTQKLEGLVPGARYGVTVVSVRGFEESEPLTGFLTTVPDGPTQLRALNLTEGSALLLWQPPQAPVDTYDIKVTAPGAPSLQDSAPGNAVDYPLQGLVLHTNYTATLHGLRGPNLTSPASITFTTGLEAPQDLEAKEVTPRTALLTWTAPQVPPTGYLLSFNTPGGQTQEILLPGGVTSHQLHGLFPSTLYSAWLRAMWDRSFTPPVSTSFTTGGLRIPFPRDCGEEMQNGVSTSRTTTIFLNGNRERPLNVFCDMETDGGGWLVFQRRMDGKTDFWRDWEDYARGFGNISEEFWLGNDALHSLTKAGDYSLRVDLRDGDEAVFAQYDSFQVDSADEYYRLHLEGYHGTAGDSMSYHSGSVFSARDRDPNNLLISCAVSYRGAWWYKNCHYANLNGLYGSTVDHQGVSWYYWKGFDFSVPFTEMKLRPRSYRPPGRGG
ncbi:tenascin-X isoform X5 [Sagmatias obliquidens]|uniref:tenascin-X isoform X5 n=1 Tax=Sagmatias obliquidens TaxID=3371155 RepID=UPI000F445D4C|nr:tenascin-X isoform X5 [Lagenorhynchus obliquidens]